jgi:transcriptional regulator with XRE-family HTH domain
VAFKDNLERLRRERFLTKAALARLTGLHEVTIARLERGVTPPTMHTVRLLAEALKVDPLELASPDEVTEREKAAA